MHRRRPHGRIRPLDLPANRPTLSPGPASARPPPHPQPREAEGKHEAVTKLQVLAERIVDDAIAGCIASRKLLVERLYPMLNRHEIAGADGEAIHIRWENQMREAAAELDRLLGIERPPEADASVN